MKRLNVAAGINGYYKVSVSNGTCQRQDSILVAASLTDSLAGPVISTSTIRFLESESSYVLDLEGTPADAGLTYQWYRNGLLVPYAQSANWKDTLALTSPRNVVTS